MSCEKNGNKAGAAAASNGVPQTSSKVGAVTAAVANKVLNVIDRDGVVAKASRSKVGWWRKRPPTPPWLYYMVQGLLEQ